MRAVLLMATVVGVVVSGSSCGSSTGPDGGTGGGTGGGTAGGAAGGTAGGAAGGVAGGSAGGAGGGAGVKFSLTLSPASVTLGQGSVATVTVAIARTGDTSALALVLTGQPTGVTGVFTPASVTSDAAQLTLTASTSAVIATSTLVVQATGTSGVATAQLPLHITAPVGVLLVDDDRSENNQGVANPTASASDNLFRNLLSGAGVTFDVYVVARDANGPTFDAMKNYTTIIWYCGSEYGGTANVGTVSSTDEAGLTAFLNQPSRKLVLFADEYLYGTPPGATWTASSSSFVTQAFGAVGYSWDSLNHTAYTAAGVGTMAGLSLSVASDTPVETFTDPLNPAVGTDVLFTTRLDPDGMGVVTAAIATGHKNVGTAGTSKALYFGFPFENVVDLGGNSKAAAFTQVLAY